LEVVLRGILTVLSQGCKWRAIDDPEASWNSIYQYYRDWSRRGLWAELFALVEPQLKGRRRFLDATHIKVHRCASNPPGGQEGQALGRTKGGMNTKLHAVVDEAGQPVSLFLSPGNDADISHAQTVLAEIPATMVVADKGYDSDAFRQWLVVRGIQPCIPPRRNRKAPARFSKASYRKRHLVENFFERIKNFRRVATRYDKLAETFFGFACLAATLVSLLW
jgi:transposase